MRWSFEPVEAGEMGLLLELGSARSPPNRRLATRGGAAAGVRLDQEMTVRYSEGQDNQLRAHEIGYRTCTPGMHDSLLCQTLLLHRWTQRG